VARAGHVTAQSDKELEATMATTETGRWREEPLFPTSGIFDETRDGRHLFWFDQSEPGVSRLVWDGVAGEPFTALLDQRGGGSIIFSPDGNHISFYVQTDGSFRVAMDDGFGPRFENISRSVAPAFTADGAHIAYGAFRDGTVQLFVDHELRESGILAPVAPVWSPDGARLAWVEQDRPDDPTARQRIVVDGSAGPWAAGVSNAEGGIQFSPDSRRLAHFESRGNGEFRCMVDGVPGPIVRDAVTPTWSPDSSRFVYMARLEREAALVDEGSLGPRWAEGLVTGFGPTGRLACVVSPGRGRWQMVVDGAAGPVHREVNVPIFSSDGRIAYGVSDSAGGLVGRFRTEARMTIEGTPVDDHVWDETSGGAFSPDGTRLFYRAQQGKEFFGIIDGQGGPGVAGVGPVAWLPDGRVAYLSDTGLLIDHERVCSVDELATPDPQRILVTSLDGSRLGWGGRRPDGWHPIVDDHLGPAYAGVSAAHFEADGTAMFHAVRNSHIYRVLFLP
jgi:WD40 repeat protein